MEIVTIEATVFESMLEYLENAARITDELCEKLREKRWGNGWIPKRSAFCWTPPPVHCRPSVRTARWHTAGSATRSIIGRRIYKRYFPPFKREREARYERAADRKA